MIFFLDDSPKKNAEYLMDKHLSFVLCNTVTIICTVMSDLGIEIPQKTYNSNKAIITWTKLSKQNFNWMVEFAQSIHNEYLKRYGVAHKTTIDIFNIPDLDLPNIDITEFPQMVYDRYKVDGDPIEAYRNFYVYEKHNTKSYLRVETPSWVAKKLSERNSVVYFDYFEAVGGSLRFARTPEGNIASQKQVDGLWTTLRELSFEEQLMLERMVEADTNFGI